MCSKYLCKHPGASVDELMRIKMCCFASQQYHQRLYNADWKPIILKGKLCASFAGYLTGLAKEVAAGGGPSCRLITQIL